MAKVLTEARAEADERDESNGQIFFVRGENGSKQIKGATPEKLIERLTDPAAYDSQFQSTVLLTYRCFIDPNTFLNFMIKRFKENLLDPKNNNSQAAGSPIQLRVCNILKSWIEKYWYDFQNDKTLLDNLLAFVESVQRGNEKLAAILTTALESKVLQLLYCDINMITHYIIMTESNVCNR